MALTVGTDSYILLADADAYLTATYLSTDAKLVAWNAMTSSDNEVLLRQATKLIDRQPLQGYKVSATQTLEFPRMMFSEYPTYLENRKVTPLYNMGRVVIYDDHWYRQTEIPPDVKYAQCEIAIALCMGEDKRSELQRQGVKSFSTTGLSETYSGSYNKVVSVVARELLMPYIGGGFSIC
jgi:hypothetical protein